MILRIFRTSVKIDFWFVAVITLMLVIFPESLAAVCFLMCILHEAGHLTAMLLCGKRAQEIHLGYFGMKIVTDKRLLSPVRDAVVAFAGPLVNLVISAIFYAVCKKDIATLSLSLGIFNLLPVTMLDGGHIISAFFPDNKLHRVLSLVCSFILLGIGIFVAAYTRENFTIMIAALYLLLGVMGEK